MHDVRAQDAGALSRHNYGRFGDEAATLAAICDRLVAGLGPSEIRLFGSRARGEGKPDSDFDLMIVFDDATGDGALDYDRAYAPVCGLGIGCDVVPCLKSDFETERDIPGTLAYEAARGRLVYRREA